MLTIPTNAVMISGWVKGHKFLVATVILVAIVISTMVIFAGGSSLEAKNISVSVGTGTAHIFLDLENRGHLPDCLIGVEVIGDFGTSLRAGLHKTVMENNVTRMVEVDKVCVNPFSTVRMRGAEGEGYHIMVFGDVEHIKVFHIYLKFESGKVLHLHAEIAGAEKGGHKH